MPSDKPQEPRHRIASRQMADRIARGEWPLGMLLPTETQIGEQFQLSRYGVRQAMQMLSDAGLILRQQGLGTLVIASTASTRYVQAVGTLDDIVQYVKGTRLVIQSRKRVASDAKFRRAFLSPDGSADDGEPARVPQHWLRLTGVRYAQARELPVSLAEIYVNDRYSDLPALGRLVTVPIYTLIEQRYRVRMTRVEQEIFGTLIVGEQAKALRVRSGAAGLRVVRKYFVDDEIIDITVGINPAERFSYQMSFELDVGGDAQQAAASRRQPRPQARPSVN